MKSLLLLLGVLLSPMLSSDKDIQKVFDVHLHGSSDVPAQLAALEQAGVHRAAISTSWNLQNSYRGKSKINFLYGLMFPCPNGHVPYSLQPCFPNGQDWPSLHWVEEQIKAGKIDFLGEILSQYYGISSSDSLLLPYYALAERYNLPVGIHTGGAGPNHGAPNFKEELGSPLHFEKLLSTFPKLKVWIMHAGDSYYSDAISIMTQNEQVYADISVLSNPAIVSADRFAAIMSAFMEAGLEDRLMFGTDNGDVRQVIAAINGLTFLSKKQKDKIFFQNAARFFAE
ncbi:hypothetical protein GCM10007415_09430 [Parapedobacter pyrenivorans]|uniref:Amidohydrolase-related domain-containing protein n=1 Tax=Parapedobacter pyrenivorans TaxID=1305674 RepID=A0A917HGZ3_9SPHI|nr:amidohydrolase family protein [Parapedobacter pyrenivorans]GGG79341.1 hypothetical protein GCM10007415_09430 [Parapedobacter pyrenivorans]